ncbi:hypothetical protein BDW42DRAFT_180245 [Aspergillus taichungensis]|uniref:CFEM domain-containing protein n=1 Tax=Aspergillus taichungensis TaxID=482145 RepID=A0A2J5HFU2_9EURO|nr:hypothetical protein BDW42DRAFT_180245 [Aspergillus taichungensis]
MKTLSLSIAALLATASMVVADVSVGQCAQMCITNMDNKASELGCPKNDHKCLCEKKDYRFGVRDCTSQACPDEDSAAVVNIALKSCPKGSTSNPNGNGDDSGSGSGSDSDSSSSASGSESTGGAGGAGGSDSSTTRSGSGSDSESTGSPKSTGSDANGSGTASATATSTGADSVSLPPQRSPEVIC